MAELDNTSAKERIRPLAEEEAKKMLAREDFRQRVKEIICEYIDSVPFEEKVQKYAGKEIDNRTLKGTKYWKGLIVSALITGIITTTLGIIAYFLFLK